MQEKQEPMEVLQKAISDVGYWRWWTAKLPGAFLVEFGGVQLYTASPKEGQPPMGVMAMIFRNPSSISFLDYGRNLANDWSWQLQEDQIEPFNLDQGKLAFNDGKAIAGYLKKAVAVNTYHGRKPSGGKLMEANVQMGFKAGDVGLCIAAESLDINTHLGKISLSQVAKMHKSWWEYWKVYWRRKNTANPMPEDYACEVTHPAKPKAKVTAYQT